MINFLNKGGIKDITITEEYQECLELTNTILSSTSAYKDLEYIKFTGTQYIQLDVTANSNIKLQSKFSLQSLGNDSIIGNHISENETFRFFQTVGSGNKIYLDYGSGDGMNRIIGNPYFTLNTEYEIEVGNRYLKDMSTNTNIISASAVTFNHTNLPLQVAHSQKNNNFTNMTLYYLKIYNNDVLIRDLIPVRSLIDNTCGLYDNITKQFYGNLGTGSIIGGVS